MFWNVIKAWKDKSTDSELSLPDRAPARPVWHSMAISHRPQSVGGSQCNGRVKRRLNSSTSLGAQLGSRPNTAPALLTGEGLIEQSPHEDQFLQQIEDKEVKRVIVNQRKENLTQKVITDALESPTLHALKVLHNSCQRARGRGSRRRVEPLKFEPDSIPEKHLETLQELGRTLDVNMRHHCYQMGMQWYQPHLAGCTQKRGSRNALVLNPDDARVADKDFKAEFGKLFRKSGRSDDEEEEHHVGTEKRLSMSRGRRRSIISQQRTASSPVLAQLADMLRERYGSFRLAFKAIASSSVMFLGDWEIALRDFAPDVDPAVLFRYLDKEFKEGVSLAEFEQVFLLQKHAGSLII